METAKRIEMSALAMQQLVVIVKDGNNKYWYLGYNDYVSATAGGGNTGTAKGDSIKVPISISTRSSTILNQAIEIIKTVNDKSLK